MTHTYPNTLIITRLSYKTSHSNENLLKKKHLRIYQDILPEFIEHVYEYVYVFNTIDTFVKYLLRSLKDILRLLSNRIKSWAVKGSKKVKGEPECVFPL